MNSMNLMITLFVVSFVDSKRDKIIACNYNVDKGPPSVIEATLCTHLLVEGIFTMDSAPHHLVFQNYERNKKILDRLKGLKSQNPYLKIVGEFDCHQNECYFEKVVDSNQKIKDFVKSAIKVMREHRFNGLNLGWRWPKENQKEGYSKLLRQLKNDLTNKETLSATVYPFESEIYDNETMESLDFVSLWTFDLFGPWDSKTEHHSPTRFVEESIEVWKGKMKNDDKILLGIGFFGVESELVNENNNGFQQMAVQKKVTNRSEYSIPYNQFCQQIKSGWNSGKELPDTEPYAYKGKRWVSFESPTSAAKKAKLVLDRGLGGVWVWEVTDDDIDDKCSTTDRPLMRAVAKALRN